MGRRRERYHRFEQTLPVTYRPTVLGRTAKRNARLRFVSAVDDSNLLANGFFGSFARNPAGTLIGILMFFLMIDFFASGAGPFAGSGIDTEFQTFYNASSWVVTLAFVLLPIALAYGFATGNVALRVNPQIEESPMMEEEGPEMKASDFDGI